MLERACHYANLIVDYNGMWTWHYLIIDKLWDNFEIAHVLHLHLINNLLYSFES
jgi:hypothetical protein